MFPCSIQCPLLCVPVPEWTRDKLLQCVRAGCFRGVELPLSGHILYSCLYRWNSVVVAYSGECIRIVDDHGWSWHSKFPETLGVPAFRSSIGDGVLD
jgi:hypothetical protein